MFYQKSAMEQMIQQNGCRSIRLRHFMLIFRGQIEVLRLRDSLGCKRSLLAYIQSCDDAVVFVVRKLYSCRSLHWSAGPRVWHTSHTVLEQLLCSPSLSWEHFTTPKFAFFREKTVVFNTFLRYEKGRDKIKNECQIFSRVSSLYFYCISSVIYWLRSIWVASNKQEWNKCGWGNGGPGDFVVK